MRKKIIFIVAISLCILLSFIGGQSYAKQEPEVSDNEIVEVLQT